MQLLTADAKASRPSTAFHVVVSTALHANLLRTADELRAEIEGVARFKEAAQRNIGIFHSAKIRFMPATSGQDISIYSPGTRSFRPCQAAEDGTVTFDGPFAYVLATTTVDRLEPDPPFLISPIVKRIQLQEGEMDVVIIRPLRDPVIQQAIGPEASDMTGQTWDALGAESKSRATAAWPARAMSSVTKAYGNGEHVDLVYATDVAAHQTEVAHVLAQEGDTREPVVEVVRCGGWEWTPTVSAYMTAEFTLLTIRAMSYKQRTLSVSTGRYRSYPLAGQSGFPWISLNNVLRLRFTARFP